MFRTYYHPHSESKHSHVESFGKTEKNHGWIECKSTKFPNRVYYFNLYSGISTWIKPVSKKVQLPYYDSKKLIREKLPVEDEVSSLCQLSQSEENESTSSKDDSSDDYTLPVSKQEKHIENIASWLYYCSEPKKTGLTSDSEYCDSVDSYLSQYENIWNSHIIPPGSEIPEIIFDCPDKILMKPDLKYTKGRNIKRHTSDSSNVFYSSTDDNFDVPYLKTIESSDMIIGRTKKRRWRRKINSKVKKKKLDVQGFCICEMYGTRTVNYNEPEAYLPPGEKCERLSDSSSSSSTCSFSSSCSSCSSSTMSKSSYESKNISKLFRIPLNIKNPNLSTSSSESAITH